MSRSIIRFLFVLASVFLGVGSASAGLIPAGDGDPAKPDLLYNENTGRVFIDPTELPGGALSSYVLDSTSASFIGANHTPVWGNGLESSTATQIGDVDPFNLVSGLVDLGLILPTGLDMAGLNAAINPFNGSGGRKATGTLGTGIFELEFFIIEYDPFVPDLFYNPGTGEVTIDASEMPGAEITAYVLNSSGGSFLGGNHNPVWGLGLESSSANQVGDSDPFNGFNGLQNLGAILPAGLDLAGLTAAITSTTVTGELGTGSFEFELLIACGTGDADCDGDVDLDDIIAAVGNFTGPCTPGTNCAGDVGSGAPFDKVRTQGDVNDGAPVVGVLPLEGDGDVDLDDIITMVGSFTGPLDAEGGMIAASAGDPGLPDLRYDSATGEVFLDGTDIGGGLQAYNIKNAGGGILNGNFTAILGGPPATDLPTEIGEFQLSSTATPAGGLSIGLVFPAGMDQAQLEAFVTGGSAAPSFGGGSFSWELIAFNVGPEVPEPATVTLLGIGLLGLALVGYRRRLTA